MATIGGYGREAFGDPMGGGGPLQVVGARAVKSQVVRVAFSEYPLAISAAGISDALNPSNYTFAVLIGAAGRPLSIGVDPDPILGAVLGVAPGQVAVDVHVDRPLIVGLRYSVTVANVVARAGGALGYPYTQEFIGTMALTAVAPLARNLELVDIQNDAFDGRFALATSGDLMNHGGMAGLRKRVLRRLTTPQNAFSFLPGYGAGVRLKDTASIAQLQALVADAEAQVKQEPEVATATVSLQQNNSNPEVLEIQVRITTRSGLTLEIGTALDSSTGVLV